jgi:preprotein translocase subunit SecA
MLNLIKKIVGTKNDREIKRIRPFVEKINSIEAQFQTLSDDDLLATTDDFKNRIQKATAQLRADLEEARTQRPG